MRRRPPFGSRRKSRRRRPGNPFPPPTVTSSSVQRFMQVGFNSLFIGAMAEIMGRALAGKSQNLGNWKFGVRHEPWDRPRSLCVCRHTGEGPNSQHGIDGACTAEGCECKQFEWLGWTLPYRKHLDDQKRKRGS